MILILFLSLFLSLYSPFFSKCSVKCSDFFYNYMYLYITTYIYFRRQMVTWFSMVYLVLCVWFLSKPLEYIILRSASSWLKNGQEFGQNYTNSIIPTSKVGLLLSHLSVLYIIPKHSKKYPNLIILFKLPLP